MYMYALICQNAIIFTSCPLFGLVIIQKMYNDLFPISPF